jgi:hypothetical protein
MQDQGMSDTLDRVEAQALMDAHTFTWQVLKGIDNGILTRWRIVRTTLHILAKPSEGPGWVPVPTLACDGMRAVWKLDHGQELCYDAS